MQIIKQLSGHSGCKIYLVTQDGSCFVRKISASESYNERLKKQLEKQKLFHDTVLQSPSILKEGFIDKCFFFDMEYINGMSFNNFIVNMPFKQTLKIFLEILNFISRKTTDRSQCYLEIIKAKYESIKLDFEKPKLNINEINSNLNDGFCHGDLTFENIIVKGKEIYLIDFLDSYIESPIIDISKIKQDLILNWSNRNNAVDNLANIKYKKLNQILDEFIIKNKMPIASVELQSKMTLLRILPYSKSLLTNLKILETI